MERNNTPIPVTEMSMNILKLRNNLTNISVQISNDILNYLQQYFIKNGKEKIYLENPYKLNTSSIQSIKYNIYSIEFDGIDIILNCDDTFGVSKSVKMKQLPAIEQAMLFDYIMAEISKNIIYVVLEERYIDQIEVSVIGTFKKLEKAEECFKRRIDSQQDEYPCIWEEAEKEDGYTDRSGYKNENYEYNICSNKHYYNIKIIEQEIK